MVGGSIRAKVDNSSLRVSSLQFKGLDFMAYSRVIDSLFKLLELPELLPSVDVPHHRNASLGFMRQVIPYLANGGSQGCILLTAEP